MVTLVIAVLFVLAFGVSVETRFRVPRFVAAFGAFKVGKLAFAGVIYRPGRAYVRIGVV